MSERTVINIADVQLTIKSDEPADFVNEIAAALDVRIREIIGKTQRYSKFDAAILCAIDYSAEKIHAEKDIKKLEHQISLLEVNNIRLKEDLSELQAKYEQLLNDMTNAGAGVEESDFENDVQALKSPVSDNVDSDSGTEQEESEDPDADNIDLINKQKLAEIEHLLKFKS